MSVQHRTQAQTRIPYRALSTAALAATIAALGVAGNASADTYKVTNTKDHGDGSLRKAIHQSDQAKGRDAIRFKQGLTGEVPVRKQQDITDPVRILGNGNSDLVLTGTLSGSKLQFVTNKRTRSRLAGLTLQRVSIEARGQGGDRGGLQVFDSHLDGDNSSGRSGIYAYKAPLTVGEVEVTGFLNDGIAVSRAPSEITDSTVDGNGGTGAVASGGDMVIEGTTLSDNRHYGAVSQYNGFVGLTNSTISGNGDPTRVDSGGINGYGGSFKIEASTITDSFFAPAAGLQKGGAAMSGSQGGTITIADSIIAGNHGRNCSPDASFLSEGGNVWQEANGCDGIKGTDVIGDPLLGPLANNGGPTKTHAIGAGSPAIGNAGPDAPDVDQRGIERDGAPDSGAYELTGG